MTEIAAELPLLVLSHLLGVPESDRGLFFDWSNQIIGNHDPDFGGTIADFLQAKDEIFAYAQDITDAKRRNPSDDLISHVIAEEMLRVTNPVLHFRRTATQDIEMGGAQIKAGEKVLLWYPSANRDESVFERPDTFDLTRQPNQHLAFGVGTHFCLGARIGRLSIKTMLRELLTRLPDISR